MTRPGEGTPPPPTASIQNGATPPSNALFPNRVFNEPAIFYSGLARVLKAT